MTYFRVARRRFNNLCPSDLNLAIHFCPSHFFRQLSSYRKARQHVGIAYMDARVASN